MIHQIAKNLQVLASKEAHAAGLKRRLGITAWREFSEDMTQGLKSIQASINLTHMRHTTEKSSDSHMCEGIFLL